MFSFALIRALRTAVGVPATTIGIEARTTLKLSGTGIGTEKCPCGEPGVTSRLSYRGAQRTW